MKRIALETKSFSAMTKCGKSKVKQTEEERKTVRSQRTGAFTFTSLLTVGACKTLKFYLKRIIPKTNIIVKNSVTYRGQHSEKCIHIMLIIIKLIVNLKIENTFLAIATISSLTYSSEKSWCMQIPLLITFVKFIRNTLFYVPFNSFAQLSCNYFWFLLWIKKSFWYILVWHLIVKPFLSVFETRADLDIKHNITTRDYLSL